MMSDNINNLLQLYQIEMDSRDIHMCEQILSNHKIQLISYSKMSVINGQLRNSVILMDQCIISNHFELDICFINFNLSTPPNLACEITMTLLTKCADFCKYVQPGENFVYDKDGKAIFGSKAETVYNQLIYEKLQKKVRQELILDTLLFQDLDSKGLEH